LKNLGGDDCDSEGGAVSSSAPWLIDPQAEEQHEHELLSISDSNDSRSASPEADDCTCKYPLFNRMQRAGMPIAERSRPISPMYMNPSIV